MNKELKILIALIASFIGLYYIPIESLRFQGAVIEALTLVKWYAREHVLLCLVPAFFIAGAISVFVSKDSVMKYFGAKANKFLSYGVASVSGTILAVCSCTVLPLFGSIYMRGAGLGPAIAFLYSGPAINVLAIVLTANVLGFEIGLARAVGAIIFSIVIGALMHFIFRKEVSEPLSNGQDMFAKGDNVGGRPLWHTVIYFFSMSAILVFANWAKPVATEGIWYAIFSVKWKLTIFFSLIFCGALWKFFNIKLWRILYLSLPVILTVLFFPKYPVISFTVGFFSLSLLTFKSGEEMNDWRNQTWDFAKQITPLLLFGVLAAGFFLGSPESKDSGIIPNIWIEALVGDNPNAFYSIIGGIGEIPAWLKTLWPIWTNFFASIVGAFMYFATLTEVPIIRGLMDSGMGKGPALSLLLAGPALSLPSMLVINSILGLKKTVTYVVLVIIMATLTGMIFGAYIN